MKGDPQVQPRRAPGRGRAVAWMVAGLALVALLGWLVIRASEPIETAEEFPEPGPPRLERVTVDGLLEGRRQWTLEVRSLEEGSEVVGLEGIERGLFLRNGNPWLTLTADRGQWITKTNGLELEGSVQIDLVEGGHLETEKVRWRGEAGVLEADTPVTATLGDDRLTAGQMRASSATGLVELGGGVELVRPGGQRLRAQGARWLDRQQRLELVGEVDWFLPSLPRPAGGAEGEPQALAPSALHEEASR